MNKSKEEFGKVLEKFLKDDRKLYDIDYREYLKEFGYMDDSSKSIISCFKKVTSFYPRVWGDSCLSPEEQEALWKFYFLFPFNPLSLARDFEEKSTAFSDGSANKITSLFLSNHLGYNIEEVVHSDELKEMFDEFFVRLTSKCKESGSTPDLYDETNSLTSSLITGCYAGRMNTSEALAQDIFRSIYARPLSGLMRYCFGNQTIELQEHQIQLEGLPNITTDFAISDNPNDILLIIEIKSYNIQELVQLMLRPPSNNERNQTTKEEVRRILHQCFAYMLSSSCEYGFLYDGFNFLELTFDFKKMAGIVENDELSIHSRDSNEDQTIPLKINYFTSGSTNPGELTSVMRLCARLYSILKQKELGTLEKTRNFIKYYQNILKMSPEEVAKEIKNRAEIYYGKHQLDNFDELELVGSCRKIQVGFQCNSQVIETTIDQLKCLINPDTLQMVDENHKVVMKIYDPVRRYFSETDEMLENYKILETLQETLQEAYSNELLIYQKIKEYNENLKDDPSNIINAPMIYKHGNIKLTLVLDGKVDFFSGGYIIMDSLNGKPNTEEHFEQGEKQLGLLHSIGLAHGDIKMSNVFYDNDRFTFIDYGFSRSVKTNASGSKGLCSGYFKGIKSQDLYDLEELKNKTLLQNT